MMFPNELTNIIFEKFNRDFPGSFLDPEGGGTGECPFVLTRAHSGVTGFRVRAPDF